MRMSIDKAEAHKVLADELAQWRSRPYAQIASLIGGEPFTKEVLGASGVTYQIEIEVVWDHKPSGDVRVLGAIDDGGWKAFSPLSDDFILSPDGFFVGE
jgi:hypothetical protein